VRIIKRTACVIGQRCRNQHHRARLFVDLRLALGIHDVQVVTDDVEFNKICLCLDSNDSQLKRISDGSGALLEGPVAVGINVLDERDPYV